MAAPVQVAQQTVSKESGSFNSVEPDPEEESTGVPVDHQEEDLAVGTPFEPSLDVATAQLEDLAIS